MCHCNYLVVTVDKDSQRDSYHAVDRAGEKIPYTEATWYKDIKRRWSYNSEGLKSYTLNPWTRCVPHRIGGSLTACMNRFYVQRF